MPIYELECERCRNRWEIFVTPATAADRIECPNCGGVGIKQISSFSFAFEGGKPSSEGVSKVNPKARRVRV